MRPLFFAPLARSGTLSPSARASEMPIAMACSRLLTGPPFPPGPLFSSPSLNSCITRPTFFDAFLPNFLPPDFLAAVFLVPDFLTPDFFAVDFFAADLPADVFFAVDLRPDFFAAALLVPFLAAVRVPFLAVLDVDFFAGIRCLSRSGLYSRMNNRWSLDLLILRAAVPLVL